MLKIFYLFGSSANGGSWGSSGDSSWSSGSDSSWSGGDFDGGEASDSW